MKSRAWELFVCDTAMPRSSAIEGALTKEAGKRWRDGGEFLAPKAAIAHGLELIDEGADILDIGGESNVTNRPAVDAQEESFFSNGDEPYLAVIQFRVKPGADTTVFPGLLSIRNLPLVWDVK